MLCPLLLSFFPLVHIHTPLVSSRTRSLSLSISLFLSVYSPPWDRISLHPRSFSVTSFLRTDCRLQTLFSILFPSSSAGHTATPILGFLRTERACDNLLERSSRTEARPPCSRALSSPPPSSPSFPPRIPLSLSRCRTSPSNGPGPAVLSALCRLLPPFLLVLIPYSCVIYAGSS